jgi:N-acetylglucosamine-6-phosphate deacetylase
LSVAVLEQLIRPAVKLITVAPELDESGKSIAFLLDHQVRVSLGHSNATFEEAQKAFDAGVRLVTHTYNALPPLHHRAPGAVIASMLDERVTNCVIADGLHVDAAAIKLLLKVKGVDKVILVTDAAHIGTTGGGLVGSSITLSQAVCNVVKWQLCSFPEAIRMATVNPAQAMGWSDKIGTLAPGSCADFILWNQEDLTIKQVYVGGELQYNATQPLATAK